jgi:hypothetical protein
MQTSLCSAASESTPTPRIAWGRWKDSLKALYIQKGGGPVIFTALNRSLPSEFPFQPRDIKHFWKTEFLKPLHQGRPNSDKRGRTACLHSSPEVKGKVTVFAHSNAGIVGSNPTRGRNACVYSVCVVLVQILLNF